MITQIKKWGDSFVVVLSPDFVKFNKIQVGDWMDYSDAFIVSRKLKEIKDESK